MAATVLGAMTMGWQFWWIKGKDVDRAASDNARGVLARGVTHDAIYWSSSMAPTEASSTPISSPSSNVPLG